MLSINNPTLSIYVVYESITLLPQGEHTIAILLDIIVPVFYNMFLIYDIILCNITCDCSHMPLHQSRNK